MFASGRSEFLPNFPMILFRWSSGGGGGNLEPSSYPSTPQGFYNPQSPDPSIGRDTPSVHSATSEAVNSRQVVGNTTYIML